MARRSGPPGWDREEAPISGAWRGLRRAAVAAVVACAGVPAVASELTERDVHLADLPPEEWQAMAAEDLPSDPGALLERILDLAPAYRFDAGAVVVDADRRWFSSFPPSEPGAPLIEVRRWPGDSVIGFYALRGSRPAEGAYRPPVPGAEWSLLPAADGPPRWEGEVDTPTGERPIIWLEREVPEVDARLGALLLPGDAGLGTSALEPLRRELLLTAERVHVRPEVWADLDREWVASTVVLPVAGAAPIDADERVSPWQIARGLDFTLGLPPGIRAQPLYPEFGGPRPVPGARLWLRGRFLNSDGEPVVLGDGQRAGYVAEVEVSEAWKSGGVAPRGASGATLIAGQEFDLAVERTRALAARAERWKEPGFAGEWLVFRLVFAERGIELALPLLAGRRSHALFWIPVTWRDADEQPAPPPIDPAKRFGIRFDRLTGSDRKRNPWIEGHLTLPGMRLDLPVGWWPVASLRSDDGFPVKLLDGSGTLAAVLDRVDGDDPRATPADGEGWTAEDRPGRHRAAEVYRREDGTVLFVAAEGHAFLLSRERALSDPGVWSRLVESALLVRSKS